MNRTAITSLTIGGGLVAAFLVAGFDASSAPVQAQDEAEPTTRSLRPGQLEDPGQPRFSTAAWDTDFSISSVHFDDVIGGGPSKDGIPAIDDPAYESIADARTWMDGLSPVIALEVSEEARAYPMAVMTWHEIANDTLGGEPVTVTFCPLCNTALAFERTIDEVVHDFGTSGNLLNSNLIMYDRQTESWWQQATGTSIVGEQMGSQLEFLPAQIISLDEFEAAYPDGDVLSRDTGFDRDYGRNPYPGYDRADESPFLFSGTADGRIAPKERVATVGEGGDAIAFAYPELSEVGAVHETVGGEPIVVLWAPGTRSALDSRAIDEGQDVGTTGVYRPIADGQALTFERLGPPGTPITDRETGSTWSITGLATEGPLAGTQLERVVSGDHLWFSWAAFNPDTRIWEPSADGGSTGEED
jgi:hypothetical protein